MDDVANSSMDEVASSSMDGVENSSMDDVADSSTNNDAASSYAQRDEERAEMRRLAWDRYLANHKGRPFLLPECHPRLRPDPTLVYYGVGVTPDELEAYARKHGFFPNQYGETENASTHGWKCVIALLSKKANFELDLRVAVSPDHVLVISVYSNIMFDAVDRKYANRAVNIVLQELGFIRPPLWYYDLDMFEGVLQLPWTPPTEEELELYKVAYREFCGVSMEYDPVQRIYRGVECTEASGPPAEK
ncbi:hypothetical protein BDW22DRAFT_409052 [Trametopsis cervina]|nr:hypothetical protein BDW22DRAFT_409052 [Trametopsis cervina]